MTILYGIKNCDTVKKARQWLDQKGVNYQFHDFRVDGIERQQVEQWIEQLGWETVVNKRSTSWKQLDSSIRENMDTLSAIEAVVENPTLVKRPLMDINDHYRVGFKAAEFESLF